LLDPHDVRRSPTAAAAKSGSSHRPVRCRRLVSKRRAHLSSGNRSNGAGKARALTE
jgi:hypothetical protein